MIGPHPADERRKAAEIDDLIDHANVIRIKIGQACQFSVVVEETGLVAFRQWFYVVVVEVYIGGVRCKNILFSF